MDDSPFSKLAPELRNQIYDLALRHDTPIAIRWLRVPDTFRLHEPTDEQRHPLALTATCKQARQETLKLFGAANTFTLLYSGLHAVYGRMLSKFWRTITPGNAKLISSITIDLCHLPTHTRYLPLQSAINQLGKWVPKHPDFTGELKVRSTCEYTEYAALQAPKRIVVEIDMRDLDASCFAALAEVSERAKLQVSWSASKMLQVLDEIMHEVMDMHGKA